MEGAPQPPAPHQAGPAEDAAADRQRQAAQHPLESMLQMGLRAAFGGMGGVQGAAPQMPQVFLQMGGAQGQWEDFVREAMDAQGGGGAGPHDNSVTAIAAHEDDDLSIGSIDFESDNSLLGMDG